MRRFASPKQDDLDGRVLTVIWLHGASRTESSVFCAEIAQAITAQFHVQALPAQSEHPEDQTLDHAAVVQLRSALTPEMCAGVVATFEGMLPSALADIRDAAARGDQATMRGAAHKLKGSVANLGAQGMVLICAELEALAENGDIGIAPSLITDLERQFVSVRTALLSEVAKV